MTTIKANELKQGDMIRTEIYSTLWKRNVETAATVIAVNEINGNYNIMLRVRDGFKEMIVDRYATANTEYKAA